MEVYEHTAINKGERFSALSAMADRISQMNTSNYESFTKQLANIKKKASLLALFVKFSKSADANLRISTRELQVIEAEPASETAMLLYLLCLAKEANKSN